MRSLLIGELWMYALDCEPAMVRECNLLMLIHMLFLPLPRRYLDRHRQVQRPGDAHDAHADDQVDGNAKHPGSNKAEFVRHGAALLLSGSPAIL